MIPSSSTSSIPSSSTSSCRRYEIPSPICADVFPINDLLHQNHSTTKAESMSLESIKSLQTISISFDILEGRKIGVAVRCLNDHQTDDIAHLAQTLIRGCRDIVGDWLNAQQTALEGYTSAGCIPRETVDKQKSMHPSPSTSTDMSQDAMGEHKVRPSMQSSNGKKIKIRTARSKKNVVGTQMSVCSAQRNERNSLNGDSLKQKIEASKRKLSEGYQQIENVKRQRRTQLLDFDQIPKKKR